MKKLYIVAGANGSGKTTFAAQFSMQEKINFINADEIAKKLNPNDINKEQMKAGKQFFKELNKSLESDKSFSIETTLSGKYTIRTIKKAQAKGFKVVLIYLFLETESEHIIRVDNRVLNGGHYVPKNDIIRRFHRSRNLFLNTYSKLVDEWLLFYNGDNKFEIVADNNYIYDTELNNKFREGEENDRP